MSNLFSIFDPQTHSFLSLNWVASLTILLALPVSFWMSTSQTTKMSKLITLFIKGELMPILGKFTFPGTVLIPSSLFIFILLNNVFGLAPYVFTCTAHLTLAFSLALPLWVGHVLYSWIYLPEEMLGHLVPLGTPPALMPFMVIIELVSNIIRPLTLSVRLAANMVAGHLLLTLLSSQAPSGSMSVLVCLLSGLVVLGALESAVAIIQAYVFSVLSTLYVSDINTLAFNSY